MTLETTYGDSSASIDHSSSTHAHGNRTTLVSIRCQGKTSYHSFKDGGNAALYYNAMSKLVRDGSLCSRTPVH